MILNKMKCKNINSSKKQNKTEIKLEIGFSKTFWSRGIRR